MEEDSTSLTYEEFNFLILQTFFFKLWNDNARLYFITNFILSADAFLECLQLF